jgi:hypothetical protein
MKAFKAAQILFISRHAGDQLMRVKLDNFVAFARAGVLYLNGNRNIRALPDGRATAPLADI